MLCAPLDANAGPAATPDFRLCAAQSEHAPLSALSATFAGGDSHRDSLMFSFRSRAETGLVLTGYLRLGTVCRPPLSDRRWCQHCHWRGGPAARPARARLAGRAAAVPTARSPHHTARSRLDSGSCRGRVTVSAPMAKLDGGALPTSLMTAGFEPWIPVTLSVAVAAPLAASRRKNQPLSSPSVEVFATHTRGFERN